MGSQEALSTRLSNYSCQYVLPSKNGNLSGPRADDFLSCSKKPVLILEDGNTLWSSFVRWLKSIYFSLKNANFVRCSHH